MSLTMSKSNVHNNIQTESLEGSEESFVILANSETENLDVSLPSTVVFVPQNSNEVSQVNSLMSGSTSSVLSAQEIQQKLESLLQENAKLKETLHQNNLAMKKQFSTLVVWQEDVMKVHQSHKEKFEETKKLIAKLRTENTELKKLLNDSSNSSSLEAESLTLKSKISALEFELETLRQANIKFKSDQSQIVNSLEKEISELKINKEAEVKQLLYQMESLKTQLHSMEQQFAEIHQKYQEALRNQPSTSAVDEINKLKQEVKQLNSELALKSKIINEKTSIIDKLQNELAQLKIDNETIPILTAQVEVYKQDFTQEREARNQLKEERDRIATDLSQLHIRNQQLLEQVEELGKDQFIHIPSSSRDEVRFICPKCSFAFYDYQALEYHVNKCIDVDMYP